MIYHISSYKSHNKLTKENTNNQKQALIRDSLYFYYSWLFLQTEKLAIAAQATYGQNGACLFYSFHINFTNTCNDIHICIDYSDVEIGQWTIN